MEGLSPQSPRSGDDPSFLSVIVETCRWAGIGLVFAIHGPNACEPAKILSAGAIPVENPSPELGRTGSVQRGLEAMPPSVDRILLWPVDMPAVRPGTVRFLIEARDLSALVQPGFRRRRGHPLVLPRPLWKPVMESEPSRPLREILAPLRRRLFKLNDPGVLLNVNTPSQYRDFLGSSAPPG